MANGVATTKEPASQGLSSAVKCIIIGIIIGVLLILSVVLYFIINRARAKKCCKTRRQGPSQRRNELTRVRKLSNAERTAEEQEAQRVIMIRKSLAARSTASSVMSRHSNIPPRDEEEGQVIDLDDNDVRPKSKGLWEDWKEFEARIYHERSSSGELHPCIAEGEIGTRQGSITASQLRAMSPRDSPCLYGLHTPSARPERDSTYEMPCLQPVRPAHIV